MQTGIGFGSIKIRDCSSEVNMDWVVERLERYISLRRAVKKLEFCKNYGFRLSYVW